MGIAHLRHRTVLQHPQQLCLEMQRNITDLVEKQRTAVGLFHLPGEIGMRIGKRPFHMSEQFTLEQGLSNGAGIHADH